MPLVEMRTEPTGALLMHAHREVAGDDGRWQSPSRRARSWEIIRRSREMAITEPTGAPPCGLPIVPTHLHAHREMKGGERRRAACP